MAVMFLVLIVVIQNLVGTLVFPRLVGRSLGLPAVWTLAAVTVGSGMAGISGIVVGVPLAAFAYRSLAEAVLKREQAEKEKKFAAGQKETEKEKEADLIREEAQP